MRSVAIRPTHIYMYANRVQGSWGEGNSRASWFRLAQKTGSSRESRALDLQKISMSTTGDARSVLDSPRWRCHGGGAYQKVDWDLGETVFRESKPRPRRPSMADSEVKELDTVSAASTAWEVTVTSPMDTVSV